MKKKLTSSLTGAFVFIILINILSRGLGFFREILFANYFGLGVNFDVYLVGAVLPITISTVVIYIGQNYFIPAYNKVKASNEFTVKDFFNVNLNIFIVSSFLLAVLLYLFSEPLIELYMHTSDPDIKRNALKIFRIFLITIPLNAGNSVLMAYQQAEYEFKYPALSRLLLNFAIIPVLIIFTDDFGIYTIPVGFVTGTALQFFYLLFKIKSHIFFPSFRFFKENNFKHVFNFTILSVILIETISQVYAISDRYFFGMVDRGGISSLNYAMKLYLLPVAVFSIALATVLLPKFSENIQSGHIDELNQNYSDAVRANLFLFVPIAFLFFFYGGDIIKILFERGKFSVEDSGVTFNVLKFYTISIIFYSTYSIYNKIIYGARLVNALLVITVAGIILKIVLNFLLVNELKQDGLALSSSISYIYFFLASFVLISIKLPALKQSVFLKDLTFYLVNGLLSYLLVEILFGSLVFVSTSKQIIKFMVFYPVFLLNIKIVEHGSVKLIKNFWKNMKSVRAI